MVKERFSIRKMIKLINLQEFTNCENLFGNMKNISYHIKLKIFFPNFWYNCGTWEIKISGITIISSLLKWLKQIFIYL